ncbi:unnamed protein product [Oncorhynchus mykiss]|uniref:SAND domain-containing protein n=1 Tax=Oncorhynchus mykiss TaxID=8022 RepID=A0A061A7F4_ONCMY|nr:unnamed protein product [Oncorhynchus mykiss]
MLHKDRFASGSCGKSIRTEQCWMTPIKFVTEGSALEDPSWKKDIQCDGKPLSVLIEVQREREQRSKLLHIHSLLCKCKLCSSTVKDRVSFPLHPQEYGGTHLPITLVKQMLQL